MRSRLQPTRDGDVFTARLAPSQVAAMCEALSHLRGHCGGDTELTLLVGARRDEVDALLD